MWPHFTARVVGVCRAGICRPQPARHRSNQSLAWRSPSAAPNPKGPCEFRRALFSIGRGCRLGRYGPVRHPPFSERQCRFARSSGISFAGRAFAENRCGRPRTSLFEKDIRLCSLLLGLASFCRLRSRQNDCGLASIRAARTNFAGSGTTSNGVLLSTDDTKSVRLEFINAPRRANLRCRRLPSRRTCILGWRSGCERRYRPKALALVQDIRRCSGPCTGIFAAEIAGVEGDSTSLTIGVVSVSPTKLLE